MTATLVAGVDFSQGVQRAIPWVRQHVVPNANVVLAHAIDSPPLPGFLRKLVPPNLAAKELAPCVEARLGVFAERAGVPDAERVARAGRADIVLRDVAAERHAALLLIGPHGGVVKPWKRLGTTAERLLRAAEVSILVARGRMSGPPRRILVAVDDVEITRCLLLRAGALASATGAELHAVHVLSPAAYSHVMSAESIGAANEAEVQRRVEADLSAETLRWLRELWAVTDHRAELHAHVPHGNAGDEILRVAQEISADLILIGRYGIGRVVPAILGSVVGSVTAGAEAPVLIVTE